MSTFWDADHPAPESIVIEGTEIKKGSRVRLHPRSGGDIMDMALARRIARVESIQQDFEDNLYVAVVVEDDPGKDLGEARQPGHRFFFSAAEIEPLEQDR